MRQILLAAIVLIGGTIPASGGELRLLLRPADSRITFVLDATAHKVRGSAEIADGEIRFDPATGSVEGTVTVDATSAQTGNQRRDRQMHRKVLRSEEFPTIVLTPRAFQGDFDPHTVSQLDLQASLRLLGREHDIEIAVTLTPEGSELRIEGDFVVPFVAWGLKDPSRFLLRVKKVVDLHIDLRGELTPRGESRQSSGERR